MKSIRPCHNLIFKFLVLLIIALGCLRISSTYSVFWQTWDEPFHIAAGIEWLEQGRYTYEELHPPLARVMGAVGPYLNGVRSIDLSSIKLDISKTGKAWIMGNMILHSGGNYEKNLTLARIGILPFFIITACMVAWWAKEIGGEASSLIATMLFTSLPPILGHSSVATLDMACCCFFFVLYSA